MCSKNCEKRRNFVMSFRPNETGRIFMKFLIGIFRVSIYKGQVSLKSDKNNGFYVKA